MADAGQPGAGAPPGAGAFWHFYAIVELLVVGTLKSPK